MIRFSTWLTVLLALTAAATQSRAQDASGPPAATPPAQQFAVAEVPFECRDFRGQKVVTMQTAGLGDVARARIIGRIPYIQMDPDRLTTLPPKLQQFFFGHECAHHVLAHNFYPTPTVELDADCWSIMNGRDRGLFTRADVADFAPFIAHSKGSASGHLPGPERAAHMLKCFDDNSVEYARRIRPRKRSKIATLGADIARQNSWHGRAPSFGPGPRLACGRVTETISHASLDFRVCPAACCCGSPRHGPDVSGVNRPGSKRGISGCACCGIPERRACSGVTGHAGYCCRA